MNKKCVLVKFALALLSVSTLSYAGATKTPATLPAVPEKTLEERIQNLENEVKEIKKKGKFEEIALDKANAASSEVLKWTEDKLLEIYSYNFMNYHDAIKYIKSFFTQPGYDSYVKALDDANNLEILTSKKMIVYAVPRGGATVEKEGVMDGIYTWEIKVPLLVSYQNKDGVVERKIDVNVEVVRQPYQASERGYAIHAIQAKEIDAPSTDKSADKPAEKSQEQPADKPAEVKK